MSVLEAMRMAVQGIVVNRLRALLTMLGITIGVAAVIILVAVGNGSAVAVRKQIEGLGTNIVTVQPGGFGFGRGSGGFQSSFTQLTLKDVKALQDPTAAPDIKSVTPVVTGTVTATFGSASYSPNQFIGTTPSYSEARKTPVEAGTFLTQADETAHNRVVVLGQTVVTNLFGNQDPARADDQAQRHRLRGRRRARAEGNERLQRSGRHRDGTVDDHAEPAHRRHRRLSQIILEAKSSHQVNAAEAEATSILTPTHSSNGTASFRVLNQASLLQTTASSDHVFTVLLAAVAAISLLVGGIGVMNIMLVTVTERTREIGIRKAIGARRTDILAQFLTEAVLLSVLGGMVGVAVGLVGSRFKIVGVQPVVELYSVLLALGVGVAVGLFFGIYPANRAAVLRPIEALRYE